MSTASKSSVRVPRASVHVALLAGGRGTRFWPLSRRRRPKQLLDITGEGEMLRVTRDRVASLCPPENVLAVTTAELARDVRRVLELPARNVLAEPVGRNTAAAVGLAALVAAVRDPDAVLLALPSDHHVASPSKLRTTLGQGVRAAAALRAPVLFGAVPDRPETGYGYLTLGDEVDLKGASGLRKLQRFREKPKLPAARRLVQGGSLWNCGMFCLHAASCLEEIERLLPELGAGLEELRPHVDRRTFREQLERIYPELPAISFDHGVLEHSKSVYGIPLDAGWSDVGSWESLAQLLSPDRDGNTSRGPALFHGSKGCLAVQSEGGRPIMMLGTEDVVVVDAGDAILVCPRGVPRDVAGLLKRLDDELL